MVKTPSIDEIVRYLNNKNITPDTNIKKAICVLKDNAVKEHNEELANKLWYLYSIFNIQKMYIEMFNLLKNNIYDDYEKAWNLREQIDKK